MWCNSFPLFLPVKNPSFPVTNNGTDLLINGNGHINKYVVFVLYKDDVKFMRYVLIRTPFYLIFLMQRQIAVLISRCLSQTFDSLKAGYSRQK